jgi:hypothetical protein
MSRNVQGDKIRLRNRFHFESLAHDNDAVASVIQSVDSAQAAAPVANGVPDTPPPIILYGTQQVPKFNRTVPDDVHISLALYRVASKNIDLVLTVNLPEKTEANTGLNPQQLQEGKDAFAAAARSLKILDFGLFA